MLGKREEEKKKCKGCGETWQEFKVQFEFDDDDDVTTFAGYCTTLKCWRSGIW